MHRLLSLSARIFFILIGVWFCLLGSASTSQAQIPVANPQDSLLLLNFNTDMQKAGWPRLWNTSQRVYFWKGIQLDPASGKVISVSLWGDDLSTPYRTATLPPTISILNRLPALKELSFSGLDLTSVPPQIGDFPNLKGLSLAYNKLTTLPDQIKNLKMLTGLSILQNRFQTLPDLSALTRLSHLSASSNSLLTSISATVFKLTALTSLDLSYCPITTVSADLGKLTKLERLDLDAGQITELPAAIGQLKQLKYLEISNNQLISLPAELGSLPALVSIDVSYNQLTALPAGLSQSTSLQGISFSGNQLPAFPACLLNIPSLVSIGGENNRMQGTIPSEIWNRAAKVSLYVTNNQLSGPLNIPNAKLSKVHILYIAGNKFTFSDIHPVYSGLVSNGAFMDLHPQAKVGTFRTFIPQAGQALSIPIDAYKPLAGGVYTWFRVPTIQGGTTPVEVSRQDTLKITSFNPARDAGVYYCKVKHPAIPSLELESNLIRVIANNQAPTFSVENITFRRGTTGQLFFGAQDDYTPREKLTYVIPNTTPHFILREDSTARPYAIRMQILPKNSSSSWLGTDTLPITVRDEHGYQRSQNVLVTLLKPTNDPPQLAPVPAIYLQKDAVACAAPQTCDSLRSWTTSMHLNSYLSDDLDKVEHLTLRLDKSDSARFARKDIYVSIYKSQSKWTLDIDLFREKDTTFNHSFTIEVTDSERGKATGTITMIASPQSNRPPTILAIPPQVIVKGTAAFPALDLKPFVQDDHSPDQDLEWSSSRAEKFSISFQDGVVLVKPLFPNQPSVDTLTYYIEERTNQYMVASVRVVYIILNQGVRISGTIQDQNGQGLKEVLLSGFPQEVKTDAQGAYSVEVAPGWGGVVTPTLSNYQFTPASKSYTNLQANTTVQHFTARYTGRYAVSGQIADATGKPLAGVALQVDGFLLGVQTDVQGNYRAEVPVSWSGKVTPTLSGYAFQPAQRVYTQVNGAQPGQHFTASLIITGLEEEEEGLLGIHPNPTDQKVQISLAKEVTQAGLVIITDVRGQVLKQYPLPAGTRTIEWDGNNESGASVSPGLYVCRVMVGKERMAVGKIIILR